MLLEIILISAVTYFTIGVLYAFYQWSSIKNLAPGMVKSAEDDMSHEERMGLEMTNLNPEAIARLLLFLQMMFKWMTFMSTYGLSQMAPTKEIAEEIFDEIERTKAQGSSD